MNRRVRTVGWVVAAVLVGALSIAARADAVADAIRSRDLREWLAYLASDELAGRGNFSTGLGLAAAYIEEHLRSWKVTPAGDSGSYLQTVRILGVKTTSRSSVTVQVGGETRTFADGEGVTFPKFVGGRRRVTIDRVEFVGYGLEAPVANHQDYRGRDVKGAAVVWLGAEGPRGFDAQVLRRVLAGRGRYAIEELQAAASLGPQPAAPAASAGASTAPAPRFDFTTSQILDQPLPPSVTADDRLFEFLFSRASVGYGELKRRAAAREGLPPVRLDGVSLTFNLDADYQIARTQLTHNVVGIIEGSDPELKSTYVAFGAHYDHLGYAEGEVTHDESGPRRAGAPGRVTPTAIDDRIWNGADDDGSGTVALMALAQAFAEGPKPRRSLLLVWHAGEELGRMGSRYFADRPTVPLDRIVAQLNIDMVGRNRDDKPGEANTVYLVGSDRISSELHAISRAANDGMPTPLTLDYQLNDPSDPEQVYYRSDHYSYAARGIPIIFFTTGLHSDYHTNTDEVSKIEFEKLARITQLVIETGRRVANLDHAPSRDRVGPRAGRPATAAQKP